MADERPSPQGPFDRNDAVRNGLLVAARALGLLMAIVGGFIALIAALLGLIRFISEEAEGYEITDVLAWLLIGMALALLGGFLARIKDPDAPVDRPDSWASR